MRHLPNLICLLRIALTWPIIALLAADRADLALALFTVAAISDGLDGWLAKRFGWTSPLGRFLDPLADKILLVFVFVYATWIGLVPIWLTAAAVARDVMIGLGASIFRIWFGPLEGRPTVVSKINTLLQIIVLVLAMLRAASGVPPWEVILALSVATLATTLISGWDYVGRFVRRAWRLAAPPA
ncbi:MAG: CDP-alcohol phosphatidyltransferase family protein [Steroidobacteraceae bacterium]|nr:CDP-alcohol phosphatidyltransferase family protein [Steroidobacteraceae bacterium]